MPAFKRKRSYSRRNKSRPYKRRRYQILSKPKRVPNVYRFKRTFRLFDFAATSGPTFDSYYFNLAQLPNMSEISNLFSQYKITGVKLRFFYTNDAATTATQSSGYFYFVFDDNDAAVPTSLDQMYQYPRLKICKMTQLDGKRNSPFIRPKAAMEVHRTGSTTSYAAYRSNPWIDLTNDSGLTNHYGIKIAYDQISTGAFLRCIATTYFKVRDMM